MSITYRYMLSTTYIATAENIFNEGEVRRSRGEAYDIYNMLCMLWLL